MRYQFLTDELNDLNEICEPYYASNPGIDDDRLVEDTPDYIREIFAKMNVMFRNMVYDIS